ncbi:Rv3235 family protein [Rhodococcus sp. (in: high G+C Gram-positive bacteria)]|uniref:Rv3235 family protein n=1 Tax=Rhodococcus sp. TaxID=1831 RepID=UPI00388FD839
MTDRHTGRYVRRIPRFEPPPQESQAPGQCVRCRPHATPRATPHDGRSGRPAGSARTPVAQAEGVPRVDATAHRFAEVALRLILEVVDGRRPVPQLTAVLEPTLVDAVSASRTSPTGAAGTAVLLRTRVHAVDANTAEVFGTYARGDRVYAVAGRIARRTPKPKSPHPWTITTLWLG